MGLIHPSGPAFAYWSDNLGTVGASGTAFGTGLTLGFSNADGPVTQTLPALAHDCEYLVLGFAGWAVGGRNTSSLLDVMIDPAGGTNWSVLISDLLVGFCSAPNFTLGTTAGLPLQYHFPLWIPAGTSIGVRARCADNGVGYSGDPRVVAFAAGGNRNPASWWCGQKVETVGTFDAGNSIGQSHTPGDSGVFSGWANLGAPVGGRSGAVQWAAQGTMNNSASARMYHFEFSAGGTRIGPTLLKGFSTGEAGAQISSGPIFCDLPAGAQFRVRGACGTTAAQAIDVAGYAVQ